MARQPKWLKNGDIDLSGLPRDHASWVIYGRNKYRELYAKDPSLSLKELSSRISKGTNSQLLWSYLSGDPKYGSPKLDTQREIASALKLTPDEELEMFVHLRGGPAVQIPVSKYSTAGWRFAVLVEAKYPKFWRDLGINDAIREATLKENSIPHTWVLEVSRKTGLPYEFIAEGESKRLSRDEAIELVDIFSRHDFPLSRTRESSPSPKRSRHRLR